MQWQSARAGGLGSRFICLEAVGIQPEKHVPLRIHVLVQVQNAVLGRSLGQSAGLQLSRVGKAGCTDGAVI